MWSTGGAIEDDDGVIAEAMGVNRARKWREKVEKVRLKLVSHPEKVGFVTQRRVLEEIENATEISMKRAAAANSRWSKTDANASANASVLHMPPSPSPSLPSLPTENHPPSADANDERVLKFPDPPLGGSTEDRYWALAEKAKAAKIGSGTMGKLIKKIAVDPEEALSLLEQALSKPAPDLYLYKIIGNREKEAGALASAASGAPSSEPAFVQLARRNGESVELRQVKGSSEFRYRIGTRTFDASGAEVGF